MARIPLFPSILTLTTSLRLPPIRAIRAFGVSRALADTHSAPARVLPNPRPGHLWMNFLRRGRVLFPLCRELIRRPGNTMPVLKYIPSENADNYQRHIVRSAALEHRVDQRVGRLLDRSAPELGDELIIGHDAGQPVAGEQEQIAGRRIAADG